MLPPCPPQLSGASAWAWPGCSEGQGPPPRSASTSTSAHPTVFLALFACHTYVYANAFDVCAGPPGSLPYGYTVAVEVGMLGMLHACIVLCLNLTCNMQLVVATRLMRVPSPLPLRPHERCQLVAWRYCAVCQRLLTHDVSCCTEVCMLDLPSV
jgi:hypothetical protein